MLSEEKELLKTHELMFNMPPPELSYSTEMMSKLEYVEYCKKNSFLDGKVAGYMLTKIEDQLNYTKQLTNFLHKDEDN